MTGESKRSDSCRPWTPVDELLDAAWDVLRKYEPEQREGCHELNHLMDAAKAVKPDA